jgi:Fic family protein
VTVPSQRISTIGDEEADMRLMQVDDAVELMRMEYAELPGLTLTFWQAQRLWNLSIDECARALKTLVESEFLARTDDGAYVQRVWTPTSTAPCRQKGASRH